MFITKKCFKFSKYQEGNEFQPHLDGPYAPNEDRSSIFTVVIFLNDDFQGGNTNFYKDSSPNKEFLSKNNKKLFFDESNLIFSVSPKKGSALIFPHQIYHEGSKILKGTKYIIRTESKYFILIILFLFK